MMVGWSPSLPLLLSLSLSAASILTGGGGGGFYTTTATPASYRAAAGDPTKPQNQTGGAGALRWLTFYNAMLNGARDTHSNVVISEHIGMLVDWSQGYGVRGILDIHRPGNATSCGDHCELFTRSRRRFNFSAPGLQGGGLRADWERDLSWTLGQAMPYLHSGEIVGVFLGDEREHTVPFKLLVACNAQRAELSWSHGAALFRDNAHTRPFDLCDHANSVLLRCGVCR